MLPGSVAAFRYRLGDSYTWGVYVVRNEGTIAHGQYADTKEQFEIITVEFNAYSKEDAYEKATVVSHAVRGRWYEYVTKFYEAKKASEQQGASGI